MINRFLAVLFLLLAPAAALATVPRTFVSAKSGMDTGACSPTAPCRSFSYAITQTTAGGEVIVLDSGGYGTVAITQAISLVAPTGVYGGITTNPLSYGITVNAGSTDHVIIRGLTITGTPGIDGIHASTFGTLVVENCSIDNFANFGITTEVAADGRRVFVRDTNIRRAAVAGIYIITNTGTIYAWISKSRFDENGNAGVFAGYGANVVCVDCEANANDFSGFRVFAHGGPDLFSELNCDRCTASGNQYGFFVEGQLNKLATLRLARSFVTGNSAAGVIEAQTAAVYVLPGTNLFAGNAVNKIGMFDPVDPDNP